MHKLLKLHTYLIFLLLFSLSSCYVETAQPLKEKQLVIVSDYLTENDTLLFKKFEVENDIDILIRNMSTNELIGYMRNARHNSGLDIVMMESLYDVLHLHKQHILHPFGEKEKMINLDSSFISTTYNFVGIGFDPYMMYYSSDTIPEITTVSKLSQNEYYSTLSQENEIVLFSQLRKKLGRPAFYSWAKSWYPHKIDLNISKTDSLTNPVLPILGFFSKHKSIDSLTKGNIKAVHLKDENGETPYNLRTICIINQSERYTLAKKFIAFYRNAGYNDDLASSLHLISIFHQLTEYKTEFIPNTHLPEKDMQYYTITERIINKLDN